MAYPRKIKNTARKLWLSGYSYEKVIAKLNEIFPDEKTPPRWCTIRDWHHKEDWELDRKEIDQRAIEKRQEELNQIAEELRAEELQDIETMNAAIQHVRYHFGRKDQDEKTIPVSDKVLLNLVNAADKAMRRKRINRYGFDTVAKVDVNDTSDLSANPNANSDDGTLPASAEND